MSLHADGDVIYIKGHCRVEDAEPLVALLQKSRKVTVDVSACESLHAAVVQAILTFDCPVVGAATDVFLAKLLTPALAGTAKS